MLAATENRSEVLDALTDSVSRFVMTLEASPPDERAQRIAALDEALLSHLAPTFEQLQMGLDAGPIEFDDVPVSIKSRWVASDGRLRVRVLPKENIDDNAALRRFVDSVRQVMPKSGGDPVINLEASRAVVSAFVQAFAWAGALVLIVLYLMFRNVGDVLVVFAPLVLAILGTVLVMYVCDLKFNFANVITLPLLVGIGVDNGVHMVHRMRKSPPRHGRVLATSTARAVVASAMTTAAGFGNLALSEHRGMASMGLLLTIGLVAVVICTLTVIPALLAPRARVG